ncbi:tRNA dimethylallyltransferase [Amylibacter marinus]|uniref:tRNA dimethylallyltransferase n=1 Tax=Amylibacter marinus TaxID=1475483 RepID=A0ABQ5VSA9_9RHOB|nr:tRNA (adenosine(37)-N6)-dimethylallyltransferase MiaA [Amylibacter marinus]GLQ34215.1 tRNA dimethylallyltransferase [Amylibacter marinus]
MEINFNSTKAILIAGATATGKSALGLRLAQRYNGVIINADALQVYADWHILTARPSAQEQASCPHRLYGHVPLNTPYSTGAWIKDLRLQLKHAQAEGLRPIILGGTGLYFKTLTQGIAEIPDISTEVKAQADDLEATLGKGIFAQLLAQADPASLAGLDAQNPMRTRRAWEVLTSTGRGISSWQADTPPPLLDIAQTTPVVLNSEVEWLNARINRRFDMMVEMGALDECRAILESGKWNPNHPSNKAIGAAEIISHLQGDLSLEAAIDSAKVQTRQYAKRQRTWFRSQMKNWHQLAIDKPLEFPL